MRKPDNTGIAIKNLRKKTEDKLKSLPGSLSSQLLDADDLKLIHELEVHQKELELQNEELMLSQSELFQAKEKYAELFDLSPTGYFTLSSKGEIQEVNLSGAAILGKPRQNLKNSNLGFFITDETRPVFNQFLDTIFYRQTKEICEVAILAEGYQPAQVLMTGISGKNLEHCLLSVVDITERKQAENALLASEQKYRLMLESSEIGLGVYSLDGTILYYNQKALRALGGKADDYVGKTLYEIFGEEAASVFVERIHQSAKSEKSIEYEEYVKLEPGDRWYLSIYSRLTNPDGTVFGVQVIAHDITERKLTEETLRASTEFTNSLIASMQDGVSVLDTKGIHIDVNPAFCLMTGFSREELLGTSPALLYWPPEEKGRIEAAFQKTLGNEKGSYEFVFMRKNGERFPVIVSPFAIKDNAGTTISYSATIKDISERKEAENRLQQSEHNLAEAERIGNTGSWEYDVASDTALWSENMFRIFGIDPKMPKEMVNSYFVKNLVHPDDRENVAAVFQDALAGRREYDFEYRILKSGNSTRYIHALAEVIRDADGKLVKMIGKVEDITDRKLNEEALKQSKAQLELAHQLAGAGTWGWDMATNELSWSKELFALFGLDPDQDKATFDTWTQVVHPDDRAGASYRIEIAIREKTQLNSEYRVVYADGQVHWISSLGNTIYNMEGEPVQMSGICTDITERKQAQQELQQSEERYRSLITNLDAGIVVHAPDTAIIMNNRRASELLGLNEDQMKGKLAIDPGWKFIGENNIPFQLSEYPVNRIIATKKPLDNTILGVIQPPEKDLAWLTVNGFPVFDAQGEIAEVLISFIDITERKTAEEALRLKNLVFDASISAISISDLNGIITEANNAFLRIWGFPTRDEVLGKPIIDFLQDAAEGIAIISALNEKGEWEGDYSARRKDGTTFTAHGQATTIKDKNGKVIGYQSSVIDITERKLAERMLQQNNEELEMLNIEKDKFFSIIAHDLRSPFNAFLGFTRMMEEELPTFTFDEIQNIATTMRKSASMLFHLLENLLEWSRMQRGLSSFKPELFLLQNQITSSVELIRDSAEKKKIQIQYNIPKDLTITADEQMFESIMRNLVFNAIKFTPKGGNVTIDAKRLPDNSAQISIRDTGIGMNKDILDKLFHLDECINRKGTADEPSTGLGLIICKDFIEKHGGKIWAESEEGHGSTFNFSIPYHAEFAHNSFITNIAPSKGKSFKGKKLKILVAEDDETSELLISIAVKRISREILKTATGSDAVAICRNNPDIDLVMMDIKMPGIDGYEATRLIRQFNKSAVIIAQTAFGKVGDSEKAKEAGCNDYISKPIDLVLFNRLLEKHFGT